MSRPPKYTDSDIVHAIQSIIAEGQDVNAIRVRTRLGGGNVARIKAILAQQSGPLAMATLVAKLPKDLAADFQRVSEAISQEMFGLARRCWAAACGGATAGVEEELVALQRRLEALNADVVASSNLVARLEEDRDEKDRQLATRTRENDQLIRECSDLKSALRNAESDLRAAQKLIETLERGQRGDRDEIRQLQGRIEELIAELAALRVTAKKTKPTR